MDEKKTNYEVDGVEKNGDLRVSVTVDGKSHLAWFRDINS